LLEIDPIPTMISISRFGDTTTRFLLLRGSEYPRGQPAAPRSSRRFFVLLPPTANADTNMPILKRAAPSNCSSAIPAPNQYYNFLGSPNTIDTPELALEPAAITLVFPDQRFLRSAGR